MKSISIDVPPLDFRAAVGAIDEDTRTVELIFSTGADVTRYDWMSGERYVERLSMKKEHVRLERLNAGAPLLNSHSSYDLSDQLGVVEEGSASVNGKVGRASVRFPKAEDDPDADRIYRKVRDKIIRNVSVGYRVHRFEETKGKDNALPVRLATDWEPYEVSLVPMPADTGARVRSHQIETNACEIVTRETPMEEQKQEQSEFLVQRDPLANDPKEPRLTLEEPKEQNDRDLGAVSERERVQGILIAVRAARLPQKVADKLIADGTPLVRAQSEIFAELGKREDPTGEPKERNTRGSVEFGVDPLVHERAGIENALMHRVNPVAFKLDPDKGRKYRGLTLLETAKLYLGARGIRVTDLSKNEIAGLALGLNHRTGYHTTSDFSLLLADVASKTLRAEYQLAPQTFTLIGRRVTLPDYKPVRRLQIGEAPALLEVKEHGEYTHGTIGEGRETMQLVKYGRKFAITREAIVNDDTDAFSRVPMKFGRAARNLESNLAWLQILSNPTMGDNNALFSTAHGNIDATGAEMSIDSIGAGRTAMALQTARDSDGVTFINADPKFLIVPPSLATKADQFVSTNLLANITGQINPFAGRLTVISEPRLEVGIGSTAGSAIAWYLAAAAEAAEVLEYGYLDGEEGPQIESRVGFDIDGLEIKCRLDFAAKAIDWKGIYKNVGAEAS